MRYLILALFLIGCNEAARVVDCVDGCSLERGLPGTPAIDSGNILIELNAERYYTGSANVNDSKSIEAGIYSIPQQLVVLEGNSGTGWLSLEIDGTYFCYQGAAPNNNTFSNVFNFRGVKLGSNCGSGGPTQSINQFIVSKDTTANLVINGGGCASICETTKVKLTITGQKFNN